MASAADLHLLFDRERRNHPAHRRQPGLISIPDNHQAFIALREDPLAAIQSAIFLVLTPDLPGILVLYLELTLFFLPMFILIAAWSSAAAALC